MLNLTAVFREHRREALPWFAVFALLAVVVISKRRFDELAERSAQFRSTTEEKLRHMKTFRDSALHVGAMLPSLPTLGKDNARLALSDLAAKGYRYLYFYHSKCRGCVTFAPVWKAMRPSARDSVAFVAYWGGTDAVVDTGPNRFAVQDKASGKSANPLVTLIPALVAVRKDGKILSVTDGYDDLVRHVRLYDLLPDSVIPAKSASPPQLKAND